MFSFLILLVWLPLWVDPSLKTSSTTSTIKEGGSEDEPGVKGEMVIKLMDEDNDRDRVDWATQRLRRWVSEGAVVQAVAVGSVAHAVATEWGRVVLTGPLHNLSVSSAPASTATVPSAAHILFRFNRYFLLFCAYSSLTLFTG